MAESVDRSHTCCICEEVYDEFDSDPPPWPCCHAFCKRCLQQMLTNNEKSCPVCRSNYRTEHSTDSLVCVKQLVSSKEKKKKPTSKRVNIKSSVETECLNHVLAFWCKSCQVSVCKSCLNLNHLLCDWVLEEEKIGELKKVLQKSTNSTRKDLTDLFYRGTANNTANLSNVRGLIKRLQKYESNFISLETQISREKDISINRLKELENMSANAGVADYTTAISKSKSIRDGLIQYPTVLDFTSLLISEDFVVPEIMDSTNSVEDTTSDVSVKICQICSVFFNSLKFYFF